VIKSRLGTVLREKGVRITDLIEKSRLSRGTIFRIQRDETISSCTLGTLEDIARILGVQIRDLFEEV